MSYSPFYDSPPVLIALVLFISMLLINRLGVTAYKKRLLKHPETKEAAFSTLEGALLGLLALLLGFTFSMSSSRFDDRREALIEEVNAIGTAVLRADLYPDSVKQILRNDFREYLEARISYYEARNDKTAIQNSLKRAGDISSRIWKKAAEFTPGEAHSIVISNQMIPALNAMIDIVTTRDEKEWARIPKSIMFLLFVLCVASSFIVGYSMKGRKTDWLILISFCLMVSITLYMILDLDKPRSGIITLNDSHQKMIELRELFNKR